MFSRPLSQIRKTLGFRLTVWYSALFIFSCAILFSLAYFLVSSTIGKYDQQLVLAKIDEYALLERTEGLPALVRAIRLQKEANLESGFLIRLADPLNKTILLTVSRHWKSLDLKKVENVSISSTAKQWRFSVPQDRGGLLEVFSIAAFPTVRSCRLPRSLKTGESSWRVSEPFSQEL